LRKPHLEELYKRMFTITKLKDLLSEYSSHILYVYEYASSAFCVKDSRVQNLYYKLLKKLLFSKKFNRNAYEWKFLYTFK